MRDQYPVISSEQVWFFQKDFCVEQITLDDPVVFFISKKRCDPLNCFCIYVVDPRETKFKDFSEGAQ